MTIRIISIIIVIFSAHLTANAQSRRHHEPSISGKTIQREITSENAERTLAQIQPRPRLTEDKWLQIIGPTRKNASVTVETGDNLWQISDKLFQNPWYWRKLWAINQQITNPHDIETGRYLNLFSPETNKTLHIPVIKLSKYGINDLGQDIFATHSIKDKFRPRLVFISEDDIVGKITGAYTHSEGLLMVDEIYVNFGDTKPNIGDKFSVIEVEKKVSGNGNDGSGVLSLITGEIKIVQIEPDQNLCRAEITTHYDVVRRDQFIVKLIPSQTDILTYDPPEELRSQVLSGEELTKTTFGRGELVRLEHGVDAGMKLGFRFRVFKDTDPLTKKTSDAVKPSYKGVVQVVSVGKLTSIGYVIKNNDTIVRGDVLIPYQLMTDVEPKKIEPRRTIEIP